MGKPRDLANVVATGNILADGAVAPAELTGVTSTAAEINILDGVTATAAELNLMDGVTATTAELNYVDGVTSNVQTQIDTKAPVADPTFTGTATAPTVNASTALQIGGVAVTATAAELNKMDGVTVSASDINDVTAKLPLSGGTLTGNIAHASDLTLDIGGDLIIDVDGADVKFKDGGTEFAHIFKSGNNVALYSAISDGDIQFIGIDGGSQTTALTLDMSDAGSAVFNNHIYVSDSSKVVFGAASDLEIYHDASNSYIAEQGTGNLNITSNSELTIDVAGNINLDTDSGEVWLKDGGTNFGRFFQSSGNLYINQPTQDKDIIIQGNDGGVNVNALTFDMSAEGAATFNGSVIIPSNLQHAGDDDTMLQFSDANTIRLVAGNTETFKTTASAITISVPATFNSTVSDADGALRAIPQSGSDKTSSYTLVVGDVGNFIGIGSGGSITVPNSTFAAGDAISIFNNTSGDRTITLSISTAYLAGEDGDKNSLTLAARGVCTILFISGTICVVSGNVS